MADQSKFLHTWKLSENSWLLKFYLFWYPVSEKDTITFCKLFWAVVCAPLMGIVWMFIGIGLAVAWPFRWAIHAWQDREKPEKKVKEPKPEKTGPSVAVRAARTIPAFFGRIADAISAWAQKHETAVAVIGWTFLGAVGLCIFGAAVFGIVLLVEWLHHIWSGVAFLDALAGLGSFILAVGLVAVIAWGLAATGWGAKVADGVWAFLCAIGRFFKAIGRFFATGYYSVKYRTCPKIEVS